jgi:hypothetical protein
MFVNGAQFSTATTRDSQEVKYEQRSSVQENVNMHK